MLTDLSPDILIVSTLSINHSISDMKVCAMPRPFPLVMIRDVPDIPVSGQIPLSGRIRFMVKFDRIIFRFLRLVKLV